MKQAPDFARDTEIVCEMLDKIEREKKAERKAVAHKAHLAELATGNRAARRKARALERRGRA